MIHWWRRRRASDRGAAAIEFVGVLPVVLLLSAIAFQLGLVGWTVVATGQAARDAARAAVSGRDANLAARAALPGILGSKPPKIKSAHTTDGRRYTVTVEIPSLIGIPLPEVERSAEMPMLP